MPASHKDIARSGVSMPPWVISVVYLSRTEALTAATAGDLEPLQRLLVALSAPYTERAGLQRYATAAPVDFGVYRTFCGT